MMTQKKNYGKKLNILEISAIFQKFPFFLGHPVVLDIIVLDIRTLFDTSK